MNIERTYFNNLIKEFNFNKLFNELGWDKVNVQQNVAVKKMNFNSKVLPKKKDLLFLLVIQ